MPTAEPVPPPPPPPGRPAADPIPPPPAGPAADAVAPTRAVPTQPAFEPVQDSPEYGWPGAGGGPGAGDAAYGAEPAVQGKGRGRDAAGQDAYPGYPGGPPRRRRRRRRRWVTAFFVLIVVLVLLTIGDRVALAIAENQFADQAVSSGMPVKPSVTIEGFPFLTQLAARDFHKVDISANNIPAGPVDITSVKATLTGMHLNSSFNGATVDHISATAFISFGALASAGGGVGGLTMTADGPDQVKITAGLGPLSDTEIAKITQTGPQTISIQVENSGSALSGILSSFGSFSFTIPKLPVQVHIQSLDVTPQGLTLTATADHATLSK